jgi:hypothetical protein
VEEIRVNSTRDQIEDFKSSILWRDIVRELQSWKQGFNLEMMSIVDDAAGSNPSSASVLMHIGDLNGRQKAVDYMLSILDVFLQSIESKKDNSKIEQTGDLDDYED